MQLSTLNGWKLLLTGPAGVPLGICAEDEQARGVRAGGRAIVGMELVDSRVHVSREGGGWDLSTSYVNELRRDVRQCAATSSIPSQTVLTRPYSPRRGFYFIWRFFGRRARRRGPARTTRRATKCCRVGTLVVLGEEEGSSSEDSESD